MSDLHRIVYFSRSRMNGPRPQVDAEFRRIVGVACDSNARAGITGAVMLNDDIFAQVLEGPEPAVTVLFERISRDRRHRQVRMLLRDAPLGRVFSDSPMAFVELGAGCSRHPLAYLTLETTLTTRSGEAGARVVKLLHSLVTRSVSTLVAAQGAGLRLARAAA